MRSPAPLLGEPFSALNSAYELDHSRTLEPFSALNQRILASPSRGGAEHREAERLGNDEFQF